MMIGDKVVKPEDIKTWTRVRPFDETIPYNGWLSATDASGNVQPEGRVDNLEGYNNASWLDHSVTVTVA